MKIEIRQASEEDAALCFAITEEAMRAYVEATWGVWEPVAQREIHAEAFSPQSHWIVLAEGKEVGLMAIEDEESHLRILKLYLRSEIRSQGVGSELLSSLLAYAASCAKPVRLRVLAVNERAQAFYDRHGFHEAFRTAERVFMEARPAPLHRTDSLWPATLASGCRACRTLGRHPD